MNARIGHFDLHVAVADWPWDLCAAVSDFARNDEMAWLDGGNPLPSENGNGSAGFEWSFVGVEPAGLIVQEDLGCATLRIGERVDRLGDAWQALRAATRDWPASAAQRSEHAEALRAQLQSSGVPSSGTAPLPGWIGFFGYELAASLERLPDAAADAGPFPLSRLALFHRGILLNHAARKAWMVRLSPPAAGRRKPEDDCNDFLDRWNSACAAGPSPARAMRVRATLETSRGEHESRVRRVLEYIRAGDIYQANLSHRIALEGLDDPAGLFARLRAANPAPHAALLRWGDRAVLSVSPECMLRVDGDRVVTRPIKGTRPRGADAVSDATAVAELVASEKDAAELAMIVDLHRNDLGRVCRYGSIRVVEPRGVESHPGVHHTVATIEGRLHDQCDAIDALRASFPAGSVTGVPKIRAMQIIRELEPCRRGVYTGAIGRLGMDGVADWSVAIRIVQVNGQTGRLHVGGGIVAESEPAAEFVETLAKADGILRGCGAMIEDHANGVARITGDGMMSTGAVTGKAARYRYTTPHV